MISAPRKVTTVPAAPPQPKGFLRTHWAPLLAAVLLNVLGTMKVSYLPSLFAIACLCRVLQEARGPRAAFRAGFAFIALSVALLDYWVLPAVLHYTNGNWGFALLCYVLSWIVLAPFFGAQFALFALLRRPQTGPRAAAANALLFAALWVLVEWGRSWLFSAVPWMAYNWGSALAGNALLVQPAAWGGAFALSFLLALPAYLIAAAWQQRRWVPGAVATAIIVLQLAGGWAALRSAEAEAARRPALRASLIQPDLPPDAFVDPKGANDVVNGLLRLNSEAAARGADVNVWTENTVPWTFRSDDDFVRALCKPLRGSATFTLLGMTTDPDPKRGAGHTSVFLLDPAGHVEGRYDKQELLAGAERPLPGGIVLPFGEGGRIDFVPGQSAPLPLPKGAVGVLLCNEMTIPAPARRRARDGATWIAVVGNDAWFADTYIPYSHFCQGRIRAVENRKDVLVNINSGEAGLFKASGQLAARFDGTEAGVEEVTVQPNPEKPPARWPFAVAILALLILTNRFFITLFSKPPNLST